MIDFTKLPQMQTQPTTPQIGLPPLPPAGYDQGGQPPQPTPGYDPNTAMGTDPTISNYWTEKLKNGYFTDFGVYIEGPRPGQPQIGLPPPPPGGDGTGYPYGQYDPYGQINMPFQDFNMPQQWTDAANFYQNIMGGGGVGASPYWNTAGNTFTQMAQGGMPVDVSGL